MGKISHNFMASFWGQFNTEEKHFYHSYHSLSHFHSSSVLLPHSVSFSPFFLSLYRGHTTLISLDSLSHFINSFDVKFVNVSEPDGK
jgi:hypothetical protein